MQVPRSPDGSKHITTAPSGALRDGALAVVKTLRDAGFEAVFAGGCVRDQVLGLVPKDWDIATSARPEEVLRLFAKAIPVGIQFGVVRVIVAGHEYEVATFRADGDYEDHRRPTSVTWAGAREDVNRRDFTINGLLEDPFAPGETDVTGATGQTGQTGRIIDFVGGLEDLKHGVIRAIGVAEKRFEDDYLRLLRAVRFSARFGFPIEAATLAAVKALAPRVNHVSAERIGAELDRILSEGGQTLGIRLLAETGLLTHILPELDSLGTAALGPSAMNPNEFSEALESTLERAARLGRCEPLMGWAVLLWDHAAHVPAIALRLRMSRAMGRDLAELIEAGRRIAVWQSLRVAEQKRVLRLTTGPRAVHLTSLIEPAPHPTHSNAGLARAALQAWSEVDLSPPPLLNGVDLKAAGFAPGPAFREALLAIETEQLEGRLTDKERALDLARRIISG